MLTKMVINNERNDSKFAGERNISTVQTQL